MIQVGRPRTLPKGLPQVAALLIVFFVNWLVFRDFFALRLQDGRLFGSLVDVLNRGAPVAILALGMTLVIATRGIDLSVGAVMAIAGATAATLTAQGYPLPVALGDSLRAISDPELKAVLEALAQGVAQSTGAPALAKD